VPRWYIECTHDNAVRIARQRAMVKAMPCKVITMECGHTPFYSQPEELPSTWRRLPGPRTDLGPQTPSIKIMGI